MPVGSGAHDLFHGLPVLRALVRRPPVLSPSREAFHAGLPDAVRLWPAQGAALSRQRVGRGAGSPAGKPGRGIRLRALGDVESARAVQPGGRHLARTGLITSLATSSARCPALAARARRLL